MVLYHFCVAFFCSSGLIWWCSGLRPRNMRSTLGLRASKPNSSPLEGSHAFRAQQAQPTLRQLARREWWLWLSAFFVATLSAVAFVLTSFPSLFRHHEHFYEMSSDQARWAILCLLLLFNGWMLYREWFFRRWRKRLSGENADAEAQQPGQIFDPSGIDPVTGLHTRAFIEQQLGKEIARARRQNTALSLASGRFRRGHQTLRPVGNGCGFERTGPAFEEGLSRLRFPGPPCRRRFPAGAARMQPGRGQIGLEPARCSRNGLFRPQNQSRLHHRVGGLSTRRSARRFAQARRATPAPLRKRRQ